MASSTPHRRPHLARLVGDAIHVESRAQSDQRRFSAWRSPAEGAVRAENKAAQAGVEGEEGCASYSVQCGDVPAPAHDRRLP